MKQWGVALLCLSLFFLALFIRTPVGLPSAEGWLPFLFVVFFISGMALILESVERLVKDGRKKKEAE